MTKIIIVNWVFSKMRIFLLFVVKVCGWVIDVPTIRQNTLVGKCASVAMQFLHFLSIWAKAKLFN